ncbi:hypothetical protein A21D_02919 [Virgibacillus dokdonensis]|uniref:Uncharacterized protein n=1 Tax=Virgibacillus dokdonensis TaxID=302167 RepID=A0A2K9J6P6_9BACI|nr:hypothetical protein A21D_02919 [Virgibacillus dokdonensis]
MKKQTLSFYYTIGKYKVFRVYSIRKTTDFAIRLGDEPSFSRINKGIMVFVVE